MSYVCVICSPDVNDVACNSLTAQLIHLLFLYYVARESNTAHVNLCTLFSSVLQFTFCIIFTLTLWTQILVSLSIFYEIYHSLSVKHILCTSL